MPIDAFTVLLFSLCLKGLLGAMFLVFWRREQRAPWFGWWSATFLLGCIANAFYMFPELRGTFARVGVGNAALIAAFACCWEAARAFDRRPVRLGVAALPPALWLAACLIPGFIESLPLRVLLSSALAAFLLGMTAFEFWRGRREPLVSRWPVIVLFSTFALLFAARIPLMHTMPSPLGALPMQPEWLGAFNLLTLAHTIILAILVVSISKERLELEQRTNAHTDQLTGALNRRAFMLQGTRLLLRHRMDGAPLCLLFLDLDGFKSLNDRLGHAAGDRILMRFVAIAQDSLRPSDLLFRLGGEEFCCLLPQTGAAQAERAAERIRRQFAAAAMQMDGQTVAATVSIGIAASECFGYDIDTLMRQADMAAYAAKRKGGNRVAVAAGESADAPDTQPRLAAAG